LKFYFVLFYFVLFYFVLFMMVFYRAIQMGRVPIFLYNDLPWIPYEGSNLSVSAYGFSAGLTHHSNELPALIHTLHNMTRQSYQEKLNGVLDARYHFTYHGVMHQIEMFLKDPFGSRGGNLRCTKHPHTERCCG
jgi:hypothetical protein